jgi:integrase
VSNKRRYGSGKVYFDRGKYRAILPGRHGKSLGRYDTQEEAQRILDTVLLTAKAGELTGYSFRQWGELWLASVEQLASYRTIKSTWGSVVLDAPFIDDSIATITRLQVIEWIESLEAKHAKRSVLKKNGKRKVVTLDRTISRQTAKHALNYVHQAFAYAKFKTILDEDPSEGLALPRWKRRRVKEPMSVLLAHEVRALLGSTLLPLEQRTVFALAIYQGPREGELAGMNWERVDFAKRGWWIAQSYDSTTKTGTTRWQQFLPISFETLLAWWEHKGRPTKGPVFPSPRGYRYSRGHDWGWQDHPEFDFYRFGWWRRVGIATRVRFHDLRDTCATHLLSGSWGKKWSMEEVRKHLGHSSVKVTEKRYAHMLDSAMEELAAATGHALQNVKSGENVLQNVLHGGTNSAAQDRTQVSDFIQGAGSEGRTRDLQHGNHQRPQSIHGLANRGSTFGAIADSASAFLAKVSSGAAVTQEELLSLATAVLAQRPSTLAMQIMGGGPSALRHAEELAGLVLGVGDEPRASAKLTAAGESRKDALRAQAQRRASQARAAKPRRR